MLLCFTEIIIAVRVTRYLHRIDHLCACVKWRCSTSLWPTLGNSVFKRTHSANPGKKLKEEKYN